MPFAVHDGVRLHWRGDGQPDRAPLLLLSSLGADLSMWDGVVRALEDRFWILRMDTRGHGASDGPVGDYDIASLAGDAAAVLDAAGARRADVCGLSLGGVVAMELALRDPDRVRRLVIANSTPAAPVPPWADRAATVRRSGMAAIVDAVMERFFSEAFRAAAPARYATARHVFLSTDPEGYAGSCMALAGFDLTERLAAIKAPTLVINGDRDVATPTAGNGDRIASIIPGARSTSLDAGHISAIERPTEFAEAVGGFLTE